MLQHYTQNRKFIFTKKPRLTFSPIPLLLNTGVCVFQSFLYGWMHTCKHSVMCGSCVSFHNRYFMILFFVKEKKGGKSRKYLMQVHDFRLFNIHWKGCSTKLLYKCIVSNENKCLYSSVWCRYPVLYCICIRYCMISLRDF